MDLALSRFVTFSMVPTGNWLLDAAGAPASPDSVTVEPTQTACPLAAAVPGLAAAPDGAAAAPDWFTSLPAWTRPSLAAAAQAASAAAPLATALGSVAT